MDFNKLRDLIDKATENARWLGREQEHLETYGNPARLVESQEQREFDDAMKKLNQFIDETEEASKLRVYVDDLRTPKWPLSWIILRNPEHAIAFIDQNWDRISEISLDHDLGEGKTGYHIAKFIEEQIELFGRKPIPNMYCHSANPVGAKNIMRVFDKYQK